MNTMILCCAAILAGLSACASAPTLHHAEARAVERTCLATTGSRVRRAAGECVPVAGRAYSKADLDAAGPADLARALSTLDPSIRVGR